ncbi:hypothetical protein FB567DRAFT_551171 [Paraphoma chrysanthemicola]|uniref:Uncharacterized protein n=1 Tax=Paraphoma chrysanthemicola TaxID=798071 RepID=A0A8K0R0S9_9PLEO|nr:hypothetical protein FB567DRAFT_551171 [Paraphoma chrysanthemicola]
MSFTNSSLAGEINLQSTDTVRVNGQEGARLLSQKDGKSGEEYADADGEYDEDGEVSADDESVDSESDEEEEEADYSVQDSENDEIDGSDEDNIEVEAESSSEQEEGDDSEEAEERLVTKSDVHCQIEVPGETESRVKSEESSEQQHALESHVKVANASTHRKFEVHEVNQQVKGALHAASHALSAVVAHAGHGNQRCDMSKVAVQCNTSSYTAHGDINYFDHAIEHHESEYTTRSESTTYAESITSQPVHNKKPGVMRGFTDKAKANLKDEEKRNSAIHMIQTGAQSARFGRVIDEVATSGTEIMDARKKGKMAVGKKVAQVAVKVAAKAYL